MVPTEEGLLEELMRILILKGGEDSQKRCSFSTKGLSEAENKTKPLYLIDKIGKLRNKIVTIENHIGDLENQEKCLIKTSQGTKQNQKRKR